MPKWLCDKCGMWHSYKTGLVDDDTHPEVDKSACKEGVNVPKV